MAFTFMTNDDAMTVPKIYLHTQGRLHVYPLFGSFGSFNMKRPEFPTTDNLDLTDIPSQIPK